MDISAHLVHRASWTPDKPALRFEGTTLTYADLERAVSLGAGWLLGRGVTCGERVAFLGPNCPELLAILYACARIGAIFVPLNPRMPASELRTFVHQCRPKLLIAEASLGDVARAVMAEAVSTFHPSSNDLRGAEEVELDPDRDPLSPALIAFTSGTTGRPKGAVFSHHSLVIGALKTMTGEGLRDDDEVLVTSPLFHMAALLSMASPSLWAGATLTIHRGFDPTQVLEDLRRFGVTRFMATPLMTRALVAHSWWAAADLSSLRTVFTGSTFIRDADVAAWQAKGVRVAQGYGMTEAPGIATTPPGASPDQVLQGGKPALFQQVRVVDRSGHDVTAGQPGEVWIRGPAMMLGYWENEEANRTAFHDGWFRTGDVGVVSEEGYLRVVDRLKDVIVVGTSNVYPADLEAALEGCPQIREAAVVGKPDNELGEVPVACVVPVSGLTLTSEQVLDLFIDRLATYKHPRQVVFLESLPRNALGKVKKAELRQLVRSTSPAERGLH